MVGLGKKCIKCLRWYPRFMFRKDGRVYQVATELGKVRTCRICSWKESGRDSVVRWNGTKFEIITLTLKQRLKELLG
jgi:hypothetical protein